MTDFQKRLQQKLREAARQSGESLSNISRSMGKDRSFLALYLSGKRNIGLKALLDIADVLPVEDWMLDGAEEEEERRIEERNRRFEETRSVGNPAGPSWREYVRNAGLLRERNPGAMVWR